MEWRFESAADVYPSMMRKELMAALHASGTADSDFASAELIYGELISNVIRHATGRVRVELTWQDDFALLCVHDENRYEPAGFELPSDPLAESGRGLYIVKTLAKEFRLTGEPPGGSTAHAILPVRRLVPYSAAEPAN